MRRPEPSEYATYYGTYVDAVPEAPIEATLASAPEELGALLASVHGAGERFAYGPDKWTIRELVGHVIDAERLFAFRALHIARGSTDPLPGMDQNDWADASNAGGRELADLVAEFQDLRRANTRWVRGLDAAAVDRRGVCSGVEFSVRALVYMIAGHELHHRRILAERYLPRLVGGAT